MFQAHFFVESGRVALARLRSFARQCMKRLTLMRRNMAKTQTALRWRTRLRSLVGAHVQALVQSGFDAPIITLPLQPLAGG